MTDVRPLWVAGRPETGATAFDVRHPYDGSVVGRCPLPSSDQVEHAVAAAWAVRDQLARTPAHVRSDALDHVARRLEERREEVAELIVAESGKPVRWALGEVDRSRSTFRWAAEEARRWSGDLQRLDTDAGGVGRLALVSRVPRGPVLAIAPFNFPLNLVAHKVAPALAVGAPVVVKPAPSTPLSALLLGELLAETHLPAGTWSVLPVANDAMAPLVRDDRLPVVSFTGSGPVGQSILESVPHKHVTLELGGNAAVVVCPDYSGETDLDHAAERIAVYGTYQAGQSCVSVQRVLVHRSLHDALAARLVARFATLRQGDPRDPATDVGPMIDDRAAERVEQWLHEATAAGARVLAGGERQGTTFAPTLVADVAPGMKVRDEEVFGPVVTLQPFDTLEGAFAEVNDSRFGLQVGVFTHDLRVAFEAHAALEVGGVVVGDVPSYRADQLPYGGTKESGRGREGVAAAMADLTYERVLVLSGVQV
ncbi:MAG: aldehyde dehydrogenase family protein [Angustibacter sp.]